MIILKPEPNEYNAFQLHSKNIKRNAHILIYARKKINSKFKFTYGMTFEFAKRVHGRAIRY